MRLRMNWGEVVCFLAGVGPSRALLAHEADLVYVIDDDKRYPSNDTQQDTGNDAQEKPKNGKHIITTTGWTG